MAIDPSAAYPGQIDTTDPVAYPYGKAQNETALGSRNGTPWEKTLVNDILGFLQSILQAASVTPNGTPDSVSSPQYLTALSTTISAPIATDRALQKRIQQASNWPERANVAASGTLNTRVPICWDGSGSTGANSGNLFVAFDANGTPYTSGDGNAWVARASLSFSGAPSAIAAGLVGGVPGFVVTDSSSGNTFVSTDGITWVAHTLGITLPSAITFAPALGRWVVAGFGALFTSSNGTTWTSQALPANWTGAFHKHINRVVWNGSIFVATTSDSYNAVITSPDGITWTERPLGHTGSWTGLAWGSTDGIWMATDGTSIAKSTNGTTWVTTTPTTTRGLNDLAELNGLWLGPTGAGGYGGINWSADAGVTWHTTSVGSHATSLQGYSSIIAADGRFVVARSSSTALEFALSMRAN